MTPKAFFFLLFCSASALAQQAVPRDTLLDHLAGRWLLDGTIEGKQTRHDVTAAWILNHEYLQLHEVSRERDSAGLPVYEAFVTLVWEKRTNEYGCLWLDNSASAMFSEKGIGRGKAVGNTIPFVFRSSATSAFHNTFEYIPESDSWKWYLDGEENGATHPFARLTLTRQ